MNVNSLITGYWYDRMASSGREAQLFGESAKEKCISAVDRSLSEGKGFGLYSEFPLSGKPFLDLTVYNNGGVDGFLEAHSFGYASLLSYSKSKKYNSICLEFDFSKGGENAPHAVVFLPYKSIDLDYIGECISLMGHRDRSEQVLKYIKKAPWEIKYFGAYLNDKDKPIRIVFRIEKDDLALIQTDMKSFLSKLSDFGFEGGELSGLSLLAQNTISLEFGFDVLPDGKLSTTLGCVYGMNNFDDRYNVESFLKSDNANVFYALEKEGIIDLRWREAIKTIFASELTLKNEDRYVTRHDIHSIKLRWKDGKLDIPKMYTEFFCNKCDTV